MRPTTGILDQAKAAEDRQAARDLAVLHRQRAVFSDDRAHRFFWRQQCGDGLFNGGGRALFVMMNGSKANEERGDMTVTKCAGFAGRGGAAEYGVVNLFTLMSTDPAGLITAGAAAHHPDSDRWVRAAMVWVKAAPSSQVIFAHGNPPFTSQPFLDLWQERRRAILKAAHHEGLRPIALAYTKDGWPRHPSRLGYEAGVSLSPLGRDGKRP